MKRTLDTNAFTDALQTKLNGVATGATAVSIQDVLDQIMAGTNITIDADTAGQITIASSGGGGGATPVQDEGTVVLAAPTAINFVGAGVAVTMVAGVATVTIAGGSAVPSTHSSQYLALKATDAPAVTDFEGVNGVAFADGSHTAIAPSTPAGNVYLLLWRIATDPEPVFLDVNHSGFNQFGALVKEATNITLTNGDVGEVWVSENALAYQAASVEFR